VRSDGARWARGAQHCLRLGKEQENAVRRGCRASRTADGAKPAAKGCLNEDGDDGEGPRALGGPKKKKEGQQLPWRLRALLAPGRVLPHHQPGACVSLMLSPNCRGEERQLGGGSRDASGFPPTRIAQGDPLGPADVAVRLRPPLAGWWWPHSRERATPTAKVPASPG
jgi:hypothetical protein